MSNTVSVVVGTPPPPANTPPLARCKNVTVTNTPGVCAAPASIDNGSSDPDTGDTITVTQSPAGPYNAGTTSVTLTVTDSKGAQASCTGTVTVLDSEPPKLTCPAPVTVECSSAPAPLPCREIPTRRTTAAPPSSTARDQVRASRSARPQ